MTTISSHIKSNPEVLRAYQEAISLSEDGLKPFKDFKKNCKEESSLEIIQLGVVAFFSFENGSMCFVFDFESYLQLLLDDRNGGMDEISAENLLHWITTIDASRDTEREGNTDQLQERALKESLSEIKHEIPFKLFFRNQHGVTGDFDLVYILI